MNSILGLVLQIINLYQLILIIYIIGTWLVNFNVINTSNRLVYSLMEAMYKLCEPSLNLVRRYLSKYKVKKYKIILEPFKKNTAPAILTAALLREIPFEQSMIFFFVG